MNTIVPTLALALSVSAASHQTVLQTYASSISPAPHAPLIEFELPHSDKKGINIDRECGFDAPRAETCSGDMEGVTIHWAPSDASELTTVDPNFGSIQLNLTRTSHNTYTGGGEIYAYDMTFIFGCDTNGNCTGQFASDHPDFFTFGMSDMTFQIRATH